LKKILLLIVIALTCIKSNACPICGCGVGNFYIGLLPGFNNKFIGVRYQYTRYETHLNGEPDEFSRDHYKMAEVWGGLNVGKRWQVLGFIPYHFNYQNTDEGVETKNGLGDMMFMANYNLWKSSKQNKNDKSSSSQEFWLGGGIKLPTGKYEVNHEDPETEIGDVNSQMGTGSLDFIANAMYNVKLGKFGINNSASYKINSSNNSNYKFGNRFVASSFAFYTAHLKNIYVAPNVGVLYEDAAINHFNKNIVEQTGGYIALGVTGFDVSIGKISMGANMQLPFAQDFADGQTVAKPRGLLQATFTF
jgi:hypothetical protein